MEHRQPIRRHFADLGRGSQPMDRSALIEWLKRRERTRQRAARVLAYLDMMKARARRNQSRRLMRRLRTERALAKRSLEHVSTRTPTKPSRGKAR